MITRTVGGTVGDEINQMKIKEKVKFCIKIGITTQSFSTFGSTQRQIEYGPLV